MSLLGKKTGESVLRLCLKSQLLRNQFASFSRSTTKFFDLPEYDGNRPVTIIPGDGIGPEMIHHVLNVLRFMKAPLAVEVDTLSGNNLTEENYTRAVKSIKNTRVALKGSLASHYGRNSGCSPNALLRRDLDLYCNILECKSFDGIPTRHNNIDITIVRQNTEAEYSLLEHETEPGTVESLKIITRWESRRIALRAFEYAALNGRKKITCIHKANIMKASDGLFLETCRDVSKLFPNIEFDDMIVDNMSMQLVSNPYQFDVLLCPNLYGTVASNIVCGLIGGAGLISGKNYGPQCAIFEPGTRNTAQDIAGRNKGNPIAMMNATADLLEHLKLEEYCLALRDAINTTINVDKVFTVDNKGNAMSSEVVDRIIDHLSQQERKFNVI